jgi:hypothetical protein
MKTKKKFPINLKNIIEKEEKKSEALEKLIPQKEDLQNT